MKTKLWISVGSGILMMALTALGAGSGGGNCKDIYFKQCTVPLDFSDIIAGCSNSAGLIMGCKNCFASGSSNCQTQAVKQCLYMKTCRVRVAISGGNRGQMAWTVVSTSTQESEDQDTFLPGGLPCPPC